MEIAIVVIAFNREASLARLLNSLNNALYPTNNINLIISIDKSETADVENLANSFVWKHGKKRVKCHEKNLGLKEHILSQGEEFESYDALIILEDDVIVSPYYYYYVIQTLHKYAYSDVIAGISLYQFPINWITAKPFEPYKNGYDVYFMNIAQSWGQVWLKNQWKSFYDWYTKNKDFSPSDEVPPIMYSWNKSWLKYHTRYCIENNKYFVYPYYSFSSNCGQVGVHAKQTYNNFQTNMQMGWERDLILPSPIDNVVKYDAFFENKALYKTLDISPNDVTLDLNQGHSIRQLKTKKYCLSTRILDYRILRSFGLRYHPMEQNVIGNVPGNAIFLYDTQINEKNINGPCEINQYLFRIPSWTWLFKNSGVTNIVSDIWVKFINKIIR